MNIALHFRRRLARWLPTTAARVFAISSLFGVLILSGVYATKEQSVIFHSLKMTGGSGFLGVLPAKPTGYAELGPDDPAVRFSETGVGQVLFSSSRNDICKRLLFDNRTGASRETNDIFCGQKPGQVVEADSPQRLDAVRKSFQR